MKLPLHFADPAFFVSHDIDVSSEGVSLELGLGDDLLFSVEIAFLGQKKRSTLPLVSSSSRFTTAICELNLYSYRCTGHG